MKNLLFWLPVLCSLLPGSSCAHERDSLGRGRMALVAVPLVIGGATMSFCDRDFRELRNGYAANFGVRFSADYDLVSPVLRGSEEWLHKLTFGMEVGMLF